MGIFDKINRFMYGVGEVLSGERESQEIVTDALRREYVAALEEKDAEIADLSEKLSEALRTANTRLERIRTLENPEPERGPVRTIAPPKTNGGRIRAMNNRELAAFLRDIDTNMGADDLRVWLESDEEKPPPG